MFKNSNSLVSSILIIAFSAFLFHSEAADSNPVPVIVVTAVIVATVGGVVLGLKILHAMEKKKDSNINDVEFLNGLFDEAEQAMKANSHKIALEMYRRYVDEYKARKADKLEIAELSSKNEQSQKMIKVLEDQIKQ